MRLTLLLTVDLKHTGPGKLPPIPWLLGAIRAKLPPVLLTKDYDKGYQARLLEAQAYALVQGDKIPDKLPGWDETAVMVRYEVREECATEDGSQGKGTGRHIAAFILEPAT